MISDLNLEGSPTVWAFMQSEAFIRLILGPVGSGKSSGCCGEIMRRSMEQAPGSDGVRKTRWAIVRNTYRELKDTTLKTWLEWFPERFMGTFHYADFSHTIKQPGIQMEVLFRALDRPEDVKKLLSLELTGAYVNEARELPISIINALKDRVGRYPPMKDGGPTWQGVILDSNMPDNDHWIYQLAEETEFDSSSVAVFKQPGGLIEVEGKFFPNPKAENLPNLSGGVDYYVRRSIGAPIDHIRVYYCSRYGFTRDGKPVYPEYVDTTHATQEPIQAMAGIPLFVGLDFGLTPAAAIGQRRPNGQWAWIDELVATDMGVVRFAELLKVKLQSEYRGYAVELWGDPSGTQRQADEKTPFMILAANGLPAEPTDTNDPMIREEAMRAYLRRMVDGLPGMIVSPKCKQLRKGMAGGFCYKKLAVLGEEKYHDKRDKNMYSHICEAAEYALLGAGEGNQLIESASAMTASDVQRLMAQGVRRR